MTQHETIERIRTATKADERKLIRSAYRAYCKYFDLYGRRGIHDAYKRPSAYKCEAFDTISRWARDIGAYNLTVVHAGCQQFSVGFMVYDIVTDTTYFVYVTRCRDLKMSINELNKEEQ